MESPGLFYNMQALIRLQQTNVTYAYLEIWHYHCKQR